MKRVNENQTHQTSLTNGEEEDEQIHQNTNRKKLLSKEEVISKKFGTLKSSN